MKYLLIPVLFALSFASETQAQLLVPTDSVPVRVSYFNVEQGVNSVSLNWKVICYLGFADFEVQRSSNGVDYTTINNFTADKIRCLSPFSINDQTSAGRVFYRLKVGDKDGNFSTSKVLVAFGKEKSFEINSVTPSVINNNALLSISSAENDKVDISIVSMQGNTVKRLQTNLSKGLTDIRLDVSGLTKGVYFIRATNSFSNLRTRRIVKL